MDYFMYVGKEAAFQAAIANISDPEDIDLALINAANFGFVDTVKYLVEEKKSTEFLYAIQAAVNPIHMLRDQPSRLAVLEYLTERAPPESYINLRTEAPSPLIMSSYVWDRREIREEPVQYKTVDAIMANRGNEKPCIESVYRESIYFLTKKGMLDHNNEVLAFACLDGNIEIIELLLGRGAQLTDYDCYALKLGVLNQNTVDYLYDQGLVGKLGESMIRWLAAWTSKSSSAVTILIGLLDREPAFDRLTLPLPVLKRLVKKGYWHESLTGMPELIALRV